MSDSWLACTAKQLQLLAAAGPQSLGNGHSQAPAGHNSPPSSSKAANPSADQPGSRAGATADQLDDSPAQSQHTGLAADVRSHVVPHPTAAARRVRSTRTSLQHGVTSSPSCCTQLMSPPPAAQLQINDELCLGQSAPESSSSLSAEQERQPIRTASSSLPTGTAPFSMRRSREQYIADVASCLEELNGGNSYELCLTNSLERTAVDIDTRAVYSTLRRINPAPHAAFLSFGGANPLVVRPFSMCPD